MQTSKSVQTCVIKRSDMNFVTRLWGLLASPMPKAKKKKQMQENFHLFFANF
jgi:hypothetical protein